MLEVIKQEHRALKIQQYIVWKEVSFFYSIVAVSDFEYLFFWYKFPYPEQCQIRNPNQTVTFKYAYMFIQN